DPLGPPPGTGYGEPPRPIPATESLYAPAPEADGQPTGSGYGTGHSVETLPELPPPPAASPSYDPGTARLTGGGRHNANSPESPTPGGWPTSPQAYGNPGDPRQQQLAQAYQQAQGYQRALEPDFPAGPHLPSPDLPSHDLPSSPQPANQSQQFGGPLGHPQTFESQGYETQNLETQGFEQQGPRYQGWEESPERTVRFDPKVHRGEETRPAEGRGYPEDPIDPTAIYAPERSSAHRAEVIAEEGARTDQAGQQPEQTPQWYGSDRR
ncbi:MAG TPA: hypothetical protein VIR33_02950, partial [Thermopolyspora sp.]